MLQEYEFDVRMVAQSRYENETTATELSCRFMPWWTQPGTHFLLPRKNDQPQVATRIARTLIRPWQREKQPKSSREISTTCSRAAAAATALLRHVLRCPRYSVIL